MPPVMKNVPFIIPKYKVPQLGSLVADYPDYHWNGRIPINNDYLPIVGSRRMSSFHSGFTYPDTIKGNIIKCPRVLIIRNNGYSPPYILPDDFVIRLKKNDIDVHNIGTFYNAGWNITTYNLLASCIPGHVNQTVSIPASGFDVLRQNTPTSNDWFIDVPIDPTTMTLGTSVQIFPEKFIGGELLTLEAQEINVNAFGSFVAYTSMQYNASLSPYTDPNFPLVPSITHLGHWNANCVYQNTLALADQKVVSDAIPRFDNIAWHVFLGKITADNVLGPSDPGQEIDGFIWQDTGAPFPNQYIQIPNPGFDPVAQRVADTIAGTKANIIRACNIPNVTLHDIGDHGTNPIIDDGLAQQIISDFFKVK